MPAELDVLSTNIIVLSGQDAVFNLTSEEIKPLLRDAQLQTIAQPIQQAQLTSLREQVVVSIVGNQFVFQDQSGGKPKGRLAEIADGFVGLLRQKGISQFKAYGFNFTVAIDTSGDSPASKLMMDRFLRIDRLKERGLNNLEGAGLRLFYRSSEAKCDLRVEPLEKSDAVRYFSQINYHYDLEEAGDIPAVEMLRSDFLGKWQVFTETLERLIG